MLDFFSVSHQATAIIIIIVIAVLQISAFISTIYKINKFKRIFPSKQGAFHIKEGQIDSSSTSRKESVLATIIDSINKYLINNKTAVSDFHLMKDIVDRNCDSLEEEVHAQIPTPLYLGLAGTMIGILVGVTLLISTGGLSDLFTTASTAVETASSAVEEILTESSGESLGEKGIEALIGGVALAMISSIIGIILTIISSYKIKNAKSRVEKNKNVFLSWIQAELLPSLPNDITGAMVKMSENLNSFNRTFVENTREFKDTLLETQNVNDSQAKLYKSITELRIKDIATANIEVYEKLKDTTDQIGLLGNYLLNIRDYSEEMHKIIPTIHDYFTEELSQIDQRKGYIAEAVGKVDDYLQQSIQNLKESSEKQLTEYKATLGTTESIFTEALSKTEEHIKAQFETLTETSNAQQEGFKKTLLVIEDTLLEKLKGSSSLVDELKNLSKIKESVDRFEKTIEKQNDNINYLVKAIDNLTRVETTSSEVSVTAKMPKFPKWMKGSIISVGILISITCLSILIPILIDWITNLINWIF